MLPVTNDISLLSDKSLIYISWWRAVEKIDQMNYSSAGPIPQKTGMGIAIPHKESIHLLHKNINLPCIKTANEWNGKPLGMEIGSALNYRPARSQWHRLEWHSG